MNIPFGMKDNPFGGELFVEGTDEKGVSKTTFNYPNRRVAQ